MKSFATWAMGYLIAGLSGGVFYREFTKLNGFTGETTLSVVHVHLLVLGLVLSLIMGIVCTITTIQDQPWFRRGVPFYHAGLILTVIMLVIRGVFQVFGTDLSSAVDAAISGFAGIGHIVLGFGLISILVGLRKATK